jgi:hypothetical protein
MERRKEEMAENKKWQPFGPQFEWACPVCSNHETMKCRECRMEKTSGFKFDPYMYIVFVKSMDDMIRELRLQTKKIRARKQGHWIIDVKTGFYYCSECFQNGSPHWKVCPACESRMESEIKKITL